MFNAMMTTQQHIQVHGHGENALNALLEYSNRSVNTIGLEIKKEALDERLALMGETINLVNDEEEPMEIEE